MVNIIGSIDNAALRFTTYHLIFTDDAILQFPVMKNRERLSDISLARMSNPKRMIPVVGAVSDYRVTQEEMAHILQENLERGHEIERNLESKLRENPPQYTTIPYSSIRQVELTNGNAVSLPHILFRMEGKKLKFHLVGYNFSGRGRLPDEVFSNYENTLSKAFGTLLIVKK